MPPPAVGPEVQALELGEKVLAYYGPLALGWIAAAALFWLLIKVLFKQNDKQSTVIEHNSATMADLAALIRDRDRSGGQQ